MRIMTFDLLTCCVSAGGARGWEHREENDPDLWEEILQKPGAEDQVSRQPREVSYGELKSHRSLLNMKWDASVNPQWLTERNDVDPCTWHMWCFAVVISLYVTVTFLLRTYIFDTLAIRKKERNYITSCCWQIHGGGAWSEWHHPGDARDRHYPGAVSSAGGAERGSFSARPPQPRQHWYPDSHMTSEWHVS